MALCAANTERNLAERILAFLTGSQIHIPANYSLGIGNRLNLRSVLDAAGRASSRSISRIKKASFGQQRRNSFPVVGKRARLETENCLASLLDPWLTKVTDVFRVSRVHHCFPYVREPQVQVINGFQSTAARLSQNIEPALRLLSQER